MLKHFFKNISQCFCVYLLAVLNLIHAIQSNSYDWLLWASLTLSALSLVLNFIKAIKECNSNAET